MNCRHLRVESTRHNFLGGDSLVNTVCNCRLKEQSQGHQLQVYQALFSQGLEGSMLTNVCPVAETGQWAKCPFYQPSTAG